MGRLVLRRLVATVPVLLLVTAGVFALIHLTPGDPIDAMMAESVDATVKATLRRQLGLDQPIHVQYAAWMGRLLHGDLGRSIRNQEPVIENVHRRIRPSLQLGTLIGGAVITEYVFALPGVGRLVVDAVFARDYPLVQGVILLIAIGFILSNLLVDLLYGWIDPRIRYR